MKSLLKFYASLVWRRLPVMMLVALIVSAVGIAVALKLPEKYKASARLLVESPQIPDQLAASTVQTSAGEQLEVIQQRLMTRANLLEIARKYQVFEDLNRMDPDEIVEAMRTQTNIRTTSGRNRATILTLSFDARKARTSADVVNEYVTLILDENVRYRTDRAEGTQDFFKQEVARLSDQIDIQKDRILRFKQQNADALPDNLAFRVERQSLLQERVSDAERRRSDLLAQKTRLVNVFNATGSVAGTSIADLPPEQRQLRELQAQLDSALTVYSETNPKVTLLKTRVEQLERVVASQTGVDEEGLDETSLLDVEIGKIDSEVENLNLQIETLETELADLSDSIARTPANAIALEALERDYANVQGQYNAGVARLAQAQTGERIELLSKGQRIAVIEQATVPDAPTSPNRPRIAQAGILGGVALAIGLFLLLEMLNNAIRRPSELTSSLGIAPFAVLPYMPTKSENRRRRIIWAVFILGTITLISVTLWAIQTYYLPLDYVFERGIEKLGIDKLLSF